MRLLVGWPADRWQSTSRIVTCIYRKNKLNYASQFFTFTSKYSSGVYAGKKTHSHSEVCRLPDHPLLHYINMHYPPMNYYSLKRTYKLPQPKTQAAKDLFHTLRGLNRKFWNWWAYMVSPAFRWKSSKTCINYVILCIYISGGNEPDTFIINYHTLIVFEGRSVWCSVPSLLLLGGLS